MKLKSEVKVQIELEVTISFTEIELRALDGMFGYGADAFIKGFYKQCGQSYVRPYEAGIRSLHEGVRTNVRIALDQINSIRNKLK